jgi:hypothetical protein
MAVRRKSAGRQRPAPRVRRTEPGEARGTRNLPPELDDLASGRSDVLRRRGPSPHGRIRDTRGLGLVPGLSNRDARRAFDARVAALRAALDAGDDAALGRGLGEALQLGLWRARKLTGFDALSEDVVGMPAAAARAQASAWAEACSTTLEVLSDVSVALWLRAEVVLLALCPQARVRIDAGSGTLSLELPALDPADLTRVLAALARTARELDRVMEAEGAARRAAPRPRGSSR